MTPELEEKLLQSVRVTSGVVQMSLQPQQAEKIIANILASIQKHNPTAIVTSVQIRRHIRKMIENEAFDVPVLSHNELLPTININIVERVNVPDLMLEAV
ncbi:MAG: FHIPEP family type III secretion protein [Candidatus Thiodiazotropha weberae]|nr:FHIPEP family type III secretion protein [Candidatus Thiodiazotropha lotti]